MAEATNSESFEEVVEWAYATLPQEIRDLPDFPGIQVADEPPEDVLKRKKWPREERCWDFTAAYIGLNGYTTT